MPIGTSTSAWLDGGDALVVPAPRRGGMAASLAALAVKVKGRGDAHVDRPESYFAARTAGRRRPGRQLGRPTVGVGDFGARLSSVAPLFFASRSCSTRLGARSSDKRQTAEPRRTTPFSAWVGQRCLLLFRDVQVLRCCCYCCCCYCCRRLCDLSEPPDGTTVDDLRRGGNPFTHSS
jgi:hypothetical protein